MLFFIIIDHLIIDYYYYGYNPEEFKNVNEKEEK